MHKQRFAQFVLPLLIENYHNGGEAAKASFMTAISVTLQAMPKQMLQKHLTTVSHFKIFGVLALCGSSDLNI